MKKLLFTLIFAVGTLFASAQFMVVTNINSPADNESWSMENFTDNMGLGYQLNEDVVIGMYKNADSYNMFGRYNFDDLYMSVDMPSEVTMDSLRVGLGYSIRFWDNFYLEPNYNVNVNGESNGQFRLGVGCRF